MVSKYLFIIFRKNGYHVQASVALLYIWCKKKKMTCRFKRIDFQRLLVTFSDVAVWYETKSIFQIFNSGVFLVRSTGPSYSSRKFRLKCSVIKQIRNIDDHKNKQLFIKISFPFWDVQINGIIYTHLPKPQKEMKNINHVQSYNSSGTFLLNYIFLYNCTKDILDTWIMNSRLFNSDPSYSSGNLLFYNQDICNLVNIYEEDLVYQNNNSLIT